MADAKISELTALTGAALAADDLFVVVDTSTTTTKSIRQDQVAAVPFVWTATHVFQVNLLIGSGTVSVGTSGIGVLVIGTSTAPTTAPADEVQFYSADYEGAAGDARLHVYSETGTIVVIGNGTLAAKKPASGAGNSITVKGSDAASGNTNGGSVILVGGAKSGSGVGGNVQIKSAGTGTYALFVERYLLDDVGLFSVYDNGGQAIVTMGPNDCTLQTQNGSLTIACGGASTNTVTVSNRILATAWVQNTPGRSRLVSAVTNTSTTFASLSELSLTLTAGRKYTGTLVLPINQALAADGFKLDLNGGTATMTSIEYGFDSAMGATLGTRTSTALATAITLTALADTADVFITVQITLVCNAGGTFIPRQAKQGDAAGGTLTLRAGGYLWLEDMPA